MEGFEEDIIEDTIEGTGDEDEEAMEEIAQAQSAPLDPDIPQWQQCSHLGALERVNIKENAVKDAKPVLRALSSTMTEDELSLPEFKHWDMSIKSLLAKNDAPEILVGFLGGTGDGKSTLVNALLGEDFADLVPTDHERASTSVVVKTVYNHSDDPYYAKVERLTRKEWKSELDKFFQDLNYQASLLPERDFEIEDRIAQTLEKLKAVYPHITEQDVKSATSAHLLRDTNVCNILGVTREVKGLNIGQFSASIRQYITSEKAKEGSDGRMFAQWPLIKLVTICVRSQILDHGLVLVDLPGSMDAVSARSAVAEEYMKHIEVFCVVAPIRRAADNENAHKALSEVTQRNMKLDGYFNGEHLCYVMTMSDDLPKVEDYLNTHSHLLGELRPELEAASQCRRNILNARDRRKRLEADQKQLQKEINKINKAIKDLKGSNLKRKRGAKAKAPAPAVEEMDPKKRQESDRLTAELIELQSQAVRKAKIVKDSSDHIRNSEEKLSSIESRKKEVCITSRNNIATEAIRKEYNTTAEELGTQRKSKELNVFCVSAAEYHSVCRALSDGRPVKGFPTKRSTGIPSLQNWLRDTTLKAREERADVFLKEAAEIKRTMSIWTLDELVGRKLLLSERLEVDREIDVYFDLLMKDLSLTNEAVQSEATEATQDVILQLLLDRKHSTTSKMTEIAERWGHRSNCGKKVTWSTFRAIATRDGVFRNSKGTQFDWPEDLTTCILEPLVAVWDEGFHKRLPEIHDRVEKDYDTRISAFAIEMISKISSSHPGIELALQMMKESCMYPVTRMCQGSKRVFGKIASTARDIHREVKPIGTLYMRPTFEYCAAQSGNGHFARNKQYMVDYIASAGSKIYDEASGRLVTGIKQLLETVAEQLNQTQEEALSDLREQIHTMLDQRSTISTHDTRPRVSNGKSQLRKHIAADLEFLGALWLKDPDCQPEVREERVADCDYDPNTFQQNEDEIEDDAASDSDYQDTENGAFDSD